LVPQGSDAPTTLYIFNNAESNSGVLSEQTSSHHRPFAIFLGKGIFY
jgi:hypothetical protein